MSAHKWLDEVRADLDEATPGPWRAALLDGVDYDDGSSSYRGGIYPAHVGAPPIILTNGVDRLDATLIASAPDRLDRMERALRSVMELADSWRYKGEFGWDDGSHAYGPDPEGEALDRASAELVSKIQEVLR